METHDPSLCTLDTWLLAMVSSFSALIAGSVYLLLG